MQLKFATLGEFTITSAQTNEVRPGNGYAHAHFCFRDIVHLVLVQPKAIGLILAIDEVH